MPSAFGMMLGIYPKKTEQVDLKDPIYNYIKSVYSERDARDSEDDLETTQELRGLIAVASANELQPTMRDTLIKYNRAIVAIESRIPVSKDKRHADVSFTWHDAFRTSKKYSQTNIHFERACILLSLAAVISQQALSCDRTSTDGLVAASKLFQEAAGVLSRIGSVASKVDAPRPQDLHPDCLQVLQKLMLAQAQECIYHKSNMDRKSPSTVARLAQQVALMYDDVTQLFNGAALGSYIDKSWPNHTAMKGSLYHVEVLAQLAKSYRSEEMVQNEICVLREAHARLQNTKKLAKMVSSAMLDSVCRVQEVVEAALSKAEKDNENIYLQRVPSFSNLAPTVQGALLVKAQPPAALDTCDSAMFESVVPDSCTKALSKYTSMLDSLTRKARDEMAAATNAARVQLKTLGLPEALEALEAGGGPSGPAALLPPALHSELESIVAIGGVDHVRAILSEIGEVRKSSEAELLAAKGALEEEARADAEARARHGARFDVVPSATVAKPYWDRISQFRKSLSQAGSSDLSVLDQLEGSEEELLQLTPEAAARRMPRLQAPMVTVGPEDPAALVVSLRKDLEALQSLSQERSAMEEALGAMKAGDNVLPRIMSCGHEAHDALFATELKKYDSILADIKSNIDQQAELLLRIEKANQSFREVFDFAGWRAACEVTAAEIREVARKYRTLLEHSSEGLQFYLGLLDVEKRCRQEAEDLAFTRSVQRDELVQDIVKRMHAEQQQLQAEALARQMSLAHLAPHPPPPHPANTAYPTYSSVAPPHASVAHYSSFQNSMPSSAAPPPPPSSLPHASTFTYPQPYPPNYANAPSSTSYGPPPYGASPVPTQPPQPPGYPPSHDNPYYNVSPPTPSHTSYYAPPASSAQQAPPPPPPPPPGGYGSFV